MTRIPKKILIADDDKIFCKIFKDSLHRDYPEKYEITTATDGEEGLKLAIELKPDLIVLDLKMPKMDGMEVLKALKEKGIVPKTPVLISTNFSDMEKMSEGFELGIKGYVVKSDYSLEGIEHRIADILEIQDEEKK
jgi:two-component system alkaline phosphatase synthesis response regulator PhoP